MALPDKFKTNCTVHAHGEMPSQHRSLRPHEVASMRFWSAAAAAGMAATVLMVTEPARANPAAPAQTQQDAQAKEPSHSYVCYMRTMTPIELDMLMRHQSYEVPTATPCGSIKRQAAARRMTNF